MIKDQSAFRIAWGGFIDEGFNAQITRIDINYSSN